VTGCATQIKETDTDKPTTGKTAKKDSVLNYSLTDLKEIDPTQDDSLSENGDLWRRIIEKFQLDQGTPPRVQREIEFYRARPKTLPEVFQRATLYLYMIVEEIDRRNMPMELALLPVIESSFHASALSGANAAGMWQFTKETAQVRGLKNNWWFDGRRDIYLSTQAALDYLQSLHQRFDGDWLHALAAYNAGAITVRNAINKNKSKGKPTDYWSLELPSETQRYVPKLLAVAKMIQEPSRYNLTLPPIANTPYFSRIEVNQQIDLATVAQLCEMPWDEFYRFNAGHKRIATDPNESITHLLVPVDKLQKFAVNLTHFAPNTSGNWISHTCRLGETLDNLATRYNTTPELIIQINKLSNHKLIPGKALLIASGQSSLEKHTQDKAQTLLESTLSLESREQRNSRQLAEKRETAKQNKIVHTLKFNQSLDWLAKHYGVSLASLAKVNNLTTKSKLRVGQQLIIPVQKVISITAKKGDTWQSIAKQYRLPAYLLAHYNKAKETDKVKSGQMIKVPMLG
jgi:membrane-bound lytic murein transglycosylase D